jgi:hypothetical protein
MANSDMVLVELSKLIGTLRRRESETKQALDDILEQIKAVEITMRLCRHDGAQTTPDIHDALVAELRKAKAQKKTQMDGLILIASKDGSIKVKEAQRLMVEAGFVSNPKNAASILYTLISRSEKFEKVKPGEYKLIGAQQSLLNRVLKV